MSDSNPKKSGSSKKQSNSDLEKISAYVPKKLHNRLIEDKEASGISLSQVIIAALANHYNMEVTVGKSGRRVTLGGETATIERVNELEQKFEEFSSNIENQIGQVLTALQNSLEVKNGYTIDHKKPLSKLIEDNIQITPKNTNSPTQLQLTTNHQEFVISGVLLAKRLNCEAKILSNHKREKSKEEFMVWSAGIDPDEISWIPGGNRKGYSPSEKTTDEQLQKIKHLLKAK